MKKPLKIGVFEASLGRSKSFCARMCRVEDEAGFLVWNIQFFNAMKSEVSPLVLLILNVRFKKKSLCFVITVQIVISFLLVFESFHGSAVHAYHYFI